MFAPNSITPTTVVIYSPDTPETPLLNGKKVSNLNGSGPRTGTVISSCCLTIGLLGVIALITTVFLSSAGWNHRNQNNNHIFLAISISGGVVASLCCALGLFGLKSLRENNDQP